MALPRFCRVALDYPAWRCLKKLFFGLSVIAFANGMLSALVVCGLKELCVVWPGDVVRRQMHDYNY